MLKLIHCDCCNKRFEPHGLVPWGGFALCPACDKRLNAEAGKTPIWLLCLHCALLLAMLAVLGWAFSDLWVELPQLLEEQKP